MSIILMIRFSWDLQEIDLKYSSLQSLFRAKFRMRIALDVGLSFIYIFHLIHLIKIVSKSSYLSRELDIYPMRACPCYSSSESNVKSEKLRYLRPDND